MRACVPWPPNVNLFYFSITQTILWALSIRSFRDINSYLYWPLGWVISIHKTCTFNTVNVLHGLITFCRLKLKDIRELREFVAWASCQIRKIALAGYAFAGNAGFSPPPRLSDPDMNHDASVMHVTWWVPGSLISGLLWSLWRGKHNFTYLLRGQFNLGLYIYTGYCGDNHANGKH